MWPPSHVPSGSDLQEKTQALLHSKVGEAGEEERTSIEHLGQGAKAPANFLALVCVLKENPVLRYRFEYLSRG